MAKIKNSYNTKCCRGCGKTDHLYIAGGKMVDNLENSLAVSLKKQRKKLNLLNTILASIVTLGHLL